MTDTVNVFTPGHLDLYDSYGLIACQLTRHLVRLGIHVNAIPLGDREMENQPPDIAAIARQPIRPSFGGFLLGYPTGYDDYGSMAAAGPRIAITMFESSEIPPAWVPILNGLDGVIVPSRFCCEVFRDCGVKTPIHVIHLGISDVYQPAERKRGPDDPFTFLCFVDRGRRKGWNHAVQAFVGAFGDRMDVRMIAKMRSVDPGKSSQFTNPNIHMLQQDMTEQELYELYLQCDCLVNPNMGEGFGLIPREFAATGGLSLATNWGGTAEDIEEWGLPIDYTLVPAWQDFPKHKGLGVWADPDIDELVLLLDVVYETRNNWRPKAYERAANIHRMYSWETFAREAYKVWQAAVKPVQVMEYA